MLLVSYVTRISFSQIEADIAEEFSNLLLIFVCFLSCSYWLQKFVHVAVSLDSFDKIFLSSFAFYLPFGAKRRLHKLASYSAQNVSCILVDL